MSYQYLDYNTIVHDTRFTRIGHIFKHQRTSNVASMLTEAEAIAQNLIQVEPYGGSRAIIIIKRLRVEVVLEPSIEILSQLTQNTTTTLSKHHNSPSRPQYGLSEPNFRS